MKPYLLNLWDSVRTSYWFVPTLFCIAALVLSFVMPRLDAMAPAAGVQLPTWARTTTETARISLSTMAGAMVAVTGTVFSITVVTLSLTSQQFGPRLLRRFMYDLPTQTTLGVFLATGFYCLLLLRVVDQPQVGSNGPHLCVLSALIMTVVSMVMLIIFIHRITTLIQAPQVVAAVAHDLDDAITRLFPPRPEDGCDETPSQETTSRRPWDGQQPELTVTSDSEGYIQSIDQSALMALASQHNLVIQLLARPGRFTCADGVLANVFPAEDQQIDSQTCEKVFVALNQTVIVGIRRTPRQDVECAIEELVEVAVRSLSPGINDPFTAMNCIDRLGAALGRLADREMPRGDRFDSQGQLRVITHPVCFGEILDAAFNQIRQYGRDSVAVTIRLLESLDAITSHLRRDEDREAVQRHAEMIARAGDAYSESWDRDEVRRRLEGIVAKNSKGTTEDRSG